MLVLTFVAACLGLATAASETAAQGFEVYEGKLSCCVCSKNIEGLYTRVRGDVFCGKGCYATRYHCRGCGEDLAGKFGNVTYYPYEGDNFCKECYDQVQANLRNASRAAAPTAAAQSLPAAGVDAGKNAGSSSPPFFLVAFGIGSVVVLGAIGFGLYRSLSNA